MKYLCVLGFRKKFCRSKKFTTTAARSGSGICRTARFLTGGKISVVRVAA